MKFKAKFFCLLASLLIALPALAFARPDVEKYPVSPIELVIPFTPGGMMDMGARAISEALAKELGVPVIVVNKPGAAGAVGVAFVVGAKPDGYTLLMHGITDLTLTKITMPGLPFDPLTAFIPIANIAYQPLGFIVRADSPFKTLGDLISYAKANPGKLKAGSHAPGTSIYMLIAEVEYLAGMKVVYVPFPGAAVIVTNVLGGHVDFGVASVVSWAPHVKAGTIRGLGHNGADRLKLIPGVPTLREAGLRVSTPPVHLSLFAPKETPKHVIKRLEDASRAVVKLPEVHEKIEMLGATVSFIDSDASRKIMEKFYEDFLELSKKVGTVK